MIDIDQAQRVAKVAANFFDQVEKEWHLEAISRDLLISACQLHEIGLSVDFNKRRNTLLIWCVIWIFPVYPRTKKLLATLLLNQTNPVDLHRCISKMPYRRAFAEQLCRLPAWPSFLPAVAATISCQR